MAVEAISKRNIPFNGSNQILSLFSIQVNQKLSQGERDDKLDWHISVLRSDDETNNFASELGAYVVVKRSSNGGPQVDSETKAAEATQEINLWTEKVTNGHIRWVLPPMVLDMSTKLLFKNAVYLQGQWGEKFDASETQDYDFHLVGGSSVKVPFMVSKEKQLVRAYDGFKVLELTLMQVQNKGYFSLCIFLPDATDGLQASVDKVDSQFRFLECHLPYEKVEVGEFRIPRLSFGFETSNGLEGLGLVLPLSGEGGVSEMVPYGRRDLYVSNKFHKSFIEVNEEGLKTAAASVSVIKTREKIDPIAASFVADHPFIEVNEEGLKTTAASVSASVSVIKKRENINSIAADFVADHPFFFRIREVGTGLVLFIGCVVNPLVG